MTTPLLPVRTSHPPDSLPDADSPMVLLSVRALQRRWEELAMEPAGPQRLWQEGFRQGSWIAGIFIGQQPGPGIEELQRLGVMVLEGLGLHKLRIAEVPEHPTEGQPGQPAKQGGWRLRWEGGWEAERVRGRWESGCWLSAGLISGYFSRAMGRDLLGLERACSGHGAAASCLLELLPRAQWPAAEQAQFSRPEQDGATAQESRSGTMQAVMDRAHRVAPLEMSVLITGESGVGKERLARTIHRLSGRNCGPFVAIDCGSLPESLLESELFGHARGAFTGAHQDRPGLFESAAGGTVLLDEIAEMPLALQTRLLRVLQEREVRRVGENRPRKVDVRVLAATHRDLAERCRQKLFREDLLFRLRVVELRLPALRERPEDILPLARRMVEAAAARHRQPVLGISPEAERALRAWSWPGNIRELENAMEQAVALTSTDLIALQDLPADIRNGRSPLRPERLEDVERAHILAVLAGQQHNQLRAAEALGIGPSTLYRKLRRWREEGLLPEEFSQRGAGDSSRGQE